MTTNVTVKPANYPSLVQTFYQLFDKTTGEMSEDWEKSPFEQVVLAGEQQVFYCTLCAEIRVVDLEYDDPRVLAAIAAKEGN